MALSLDIDLYNWLLEEVLKVNPTGDPVNDAVYLVLLPMVVLYMFVERTVHNSRFNNAKVEFIIMFIIGFFIVREGYYPLFAGFALPLLIIIMLWHAGGFILGRGSEEKKKKEEIIARGAPGSGGEEIMGDTRSTLGSLSKLIDDVKHPGKFGSGLKAVEINDINELQKRVERGIDSFSKIAGSYGGDKKATEIVIELTQMDNELEEIKRDLKRGEYRGNLEKEIESFRDKLTAILSKERNYTR